MRGVCALVVFLHHLMFLATAKNPIPHGYLAVDAFFVISGFVIAASYGDRLLGGLSVPSFLKARVRRLGPTYWLGLILGSIATAIVMIGFRHTQPAIAVAAILTLLALEAVLIPATTGKASSFLLNTPSWSIFSEMIVNVLYAVLVTRLRRFALVAIVTIGWTASAAIAFSRPDGWNFGWSGDTALLSIVRAAPAFSAGVLLFDFWRKGQLEHLPRVSPLLLVCLWCSVAIIPKQISPVAVDTVSVILVTPLLIALLVRAEAHSPRWFTTAGELSYPLYICQMPILVVAKCVLPFSAHPILNFLLLLPAGALVLAVAWTVHVWLEDAVTAARNAPVPRPLGVSGEAVKLEAT